MTPTPPKRAAARHGLPRIRTMLPVALLLALTACATPPAKLDQPALRDHAPLAGLNTPTRAGWPDPQWWRAYHDPQLDTLIAQAMKQAPDLALAQSRVRQAEQSARLAAAQAGLTINGSAQVARQRLSDNGMIPPEFLGFNWYNQGDLGIQLQYDFDWWGKKRAAIESALDQAHAAQAQRSAAALAIQYAVADTYFGWQADQARLKLAEQTVQTQQQFDHIAKLRVRQGVDLPDEAQKADAQLAQAREMRVALAGSAKIRRVALASLLGVSPAELPPLQARPLPHVDSAVPADAGLDLLARRPDIAASRWQVEAALRQTDVARAQFFPDISISAMAGLSSIDLGKMLTAGSRTFAVTPALHLPIFSGGQLQANYGISKAQLASAVAQYDSTVITAAREVATQALGARQIADRRQQEAVQLQANENLLTKAQARKRQGVRDAREALGAKAQWLQQRDNAIQLHAQALATDLNLIKALGGGYQPPAMPTADDPDGDTATAPHSTSPLAGDASHERH